MLTMTKSTRAKIKRTEPVTQQRLGTSTITGRNLCNASQLQMHDKLSSIMYYSFVGRQGSQCKLLNEADNKEYLIDNEIIQ